MIKNFRDINIFPCQFNNNIINISQQKEILGKRRKYTKNKENIYRVYIDLRILQIH